MTDDLRHSGEDFLRPRLPDSSARKHLAYLLLLRLKVPGTDMGKVANEAISLLVDLQDPSQLRGAISGMEAVEVAAWIPSLEEDSVQQLHSALVSTDMPCKGVVRKELAQRLASLLNPERLTSLWQLLCANDPADSWMQAAACFLCAHLNRLELGLQDIPSEMLTEAAKFMDDQGLAVAFANSFFKYDLGISAFEEWPIKSTAGILFELAKREERQGEKLPLLLKGHRVDESNMQIRVAVAMQLKHHILRDDGGVSDMEGLFLKLILNEGDSVEGSIPEKVLSKLTLQERHLKQASPQQLINLSHLLGRNKREADGARVAVFAAKAFAASGKARDSEHAYLTAFEMDHSNREVAAGLVRAVRSAHQRCEALESAVRRLEAPRREVGSSLVWDLSTYDFSDFTKGNGQLSDTVMLPNGINAWLFLFPKGRSDSSEGMAALYFIVDRPAIAMWTVQSRLGQVMTAVYDFSKDLDNNGKPLGQGWSDFMPISETNDSITLRILSVQLPGSAMRLI